MNRYKLSKAGVSVNEGIARFGGDKTLYESLLIRFAEDQNFENLKAALAARDAKAAFLAAHSLKGVSGNLSLTRLYDDIQPLVELLRAGRLDGAEELLQPVEKDMADLLEVLQN